MSRFRVITYNIHRCRGMDWRVRPERVAQVLHQLGGDIIALQEVFEDQLEILKRSVELPCTFGLAQVLEGRRFGNVIFCRFPVLDTRVLDLSVAGREQRTCLRMDVELPGKSTLHFFGLHLGTSFLERREQTRLLMSQEVLCNPDLYSARLVAGDFNEWTRGLATRTLSRELESADMRRHLARGSSYPGLLPLLHLDHMYYDPPLQLKRLLLDDSLAAKIASDHLPLAADFEWIDASH